MSNAALVFAALCAKAANVAVADTVTEVSLSTPKQREALPLPTLSIGTVSEMCAKSRDFLVSDEASQTRSCGNEAEAISSSYPSCHSKAYEFQNNSSRRSRTSNSNDVNYFEAANEAPTLQRYLSGYTTDSHRDHVSSSRHSRASALHYHNDAKRPDLLDSGRKSCRSLMDDSHHSRTDKSVQMDVDDFLQMAKQMVIAPSGGVDHCLDLPLTTITRQKSASSCDMSTTSSISDPDSRRDSVDDLVLDLDPDNLIEALCKKAQTDSALARKLATAAKQLPSSESKDDDDAVEEVIAKLFARLSAVNGGVTESGSRGSGKSSKTKSFDSNEKSPQRSPAVGGRKRKPRKGGGRSQRQSPGDSLDVSPKTATTPALDCSSLINASNEVPSDEALLQIGWFKAIDATTGRYYFYTEDRASVSWENPFISPSLVAGVKTTVSLNDSDPFMIDPFENDDADDGDDCFQVVYARNDSGRSSGRTSVVR